MSERSISRCVQASSTGEVASGYEALKADPLSSAGPTSSMLALPARRTTFTVSIDVPLGAASSIVEITTPAFEGSNNVRVDVVGELDLRDGVRYLFL